MTPDEKRHANSTAVRFLIGAALVFYSGYSWNENIALALFCVWVGVLFIFSRLLNI
jgi:hypothetical protein